jgi:hypothetical protein
MSMSQKTRIVILGFSMWLAHYIFHFLASWGAVTPVLERFAGDLGWTVFGEPAWALACCRPVADWLPRLEILSLDVGLLLSLYSGYRIALNQSERPSQALKLLAPWAALLVPGHYRGCDQQTFPRRPVRAARAGPLGTVC